MKRADKSLLLYKVFFIVTVYACLIGSICSLHVKNATAYVASLSAVCENTFTGREQVDPVASPTPEEPPSPPTGDEGWIEWYFWMMLFSAFGVLLVSYKQYREKFQNNNKKEK